MIKFYGVIIWVTIILITCLIYLATLIKDKDNDKDNTGGFLF